MCELPLSVVNTDDYISNLTIMVQTESHTAWDPRLSLMAQNNQDNLPDTPFLLKIKGNFPLIVSVVTCQTLILWSHSVLDWLGHNSLAYTLVSEVPQQYRYRPYYIASLGLPEAERCLWCRPPGDQVAFWFMVAGGLWSCGRQDGHKCGFREEAWRTITHRIPRSINANTSI